MKSLLSVTLRELLPPSISDDPDIVAAAESIDAELRKVTQSIHNVSILPRLRQITDSHLIDLLAWQFHVDFYDTVLPLEVRRELVAKSLEWHTRKGTPSVVEEIVSVVFADAVLQEWWEYGGDPYTFKVGTEITSVSAEEIQRLIAAIFSVKNTRSWLEVIEILWSAPQTVYHGAGVTQAKTTNIAAVFISTGPDGEISRSTYNFASFVALRPRITIEGE